MQCPHNQVCVETQSGESFPLYIQAYIDTIEAVKAKVEARTGCPANDQQLMIGEKELTITTMITDDCVISLKRRKDFEAKRSAKLYERYEQLATDLLDTLHKYKEGRLQATLQMESNTQLEVELQEASLGTMPLTNVAVCLLPLLELQSWFDQEAQNSKQFDMLRGVIIEWLSQVDTVIQNRLSFKSNKVESNQVERKVERKGTGSILEQARKWKEQESARTDNSDEFVGSLSPLYLNEEKCAAVAELLMLNMIYPSRIEILLCHSNSSVSSQTGLKPELSIGRGPLHEHLACGRTLFLMTAMDMFLEFLEKHLSKEHSPAEQEYSKALSSYVNLIWGCVDLDGDGQLSQGESLDFCQVILSRAALGRLLLTCVCVVAANDDHGVPSVARESLMSVIPSLVLTFVGENMEVASENFWNEMDFDRCGAVFMSEFCHHFPLAFWKTFVLPLSGRLAAKSKELKNAEEGKSVHVFAAEPSPTEEAEQVKTAEQIRKGRSIWTENVTEEAEQLKTVHIVASERSPPAEREIPLRENENDCCARNCTGASAFHSCIPEPTPAQPKLTQPYPAQSYPDQPSLAQPGPNRNFPLPPHPLMDTRLKAGSDDAGTDELRNRDKAVHEMKILMSPDEDGCHLEDNLNVDETVVKGSSKFSCKPACYGGSSKRPCFPKHSDVLKQHCSDPLDACHDSVTNGSEKEARNAACNVM